MRELGPIDTGLLEKLVDKYSLRSVLDALGRICDDKALFLGGDGQPARAWQEAGDDLAKVQGFMTVRAVSNE